jgi:hypothetical protein
LGLVFVALPVYVQVMSPCSVPGGGSALACMQYKESKQSHADQHLGISARLPSTAHQITHLSISAMLMQFKAHSAKNCKGQEDNHQNVRPMEVHR